MPTQEGDKPYIDAFTGQGAVRVIDDAGGADLSRNMTVEDFTTAIGGGGGGLDPEELDAETAALIADGDSDTSGALGVLLVEKVSRVLDTSVVYGTDGAGAATTYATSLFLAQPNWLGNWDIGTAYDEGDLVRYTDNAVYIALRSTTGDAPDSSALDWDLFIPAPVDGVTPDTSFVFQQIIYDGSWPDRDTLPFAGPVMWINPTNDTPPAAGDPYFIDGDLVVLNIAEA